MVDELAVASILLAAVALISCLSVANKRTIRRMPRGAWVAVIVLVPLGGATAWFLLGRPLSLHTKARFRGAPPVAPEDDPGFLSSLDSSLDQASRPGRPADPPPPPPLPPRPAAADPTHPDDEPDRT